MGAQDCINNSKLAKESLRAELNDAIKERRKQLGPDPRFNASVAIRDVTREHLNDVRARKVRLARQKNAVSSVDTRLAEAKDRRGLNPYYFAAESLLDRDPTGRFNNNSRMNATGAWRVFRSEIDRAGGPIIDKFRARYWESIPKLLTPFSDYTKHGLDVVELVRAMTGLPTDNVEMRELAAALSRMSDVAIANFRQQGGEIGKLENFVPHDWVPDRLKGLDRDDWVNEMLGTVLGSETPILDRGLIRDVHTGKPLNEAQLRTALEDAFDTISTDGLNKLEARPGKYRAGRSTYRVQDFSRFLHFTPEGYLHLLPKYMHDDVVTTMMAWFDRMAKDTGLMHVMGPTPSLTAKYVQDRLETLGKESNGRTNAKKFDNLMKSFNDRGDNNIPVSKFIASIGSIIRQISILRHLGSAVIHSALIGDASSATLRFGKDGFGPFGYARDLASALANNDIDAAAFRDHQVIWDSRYYGMADHARTYGDLAFASRKIGNATRTMLDASGLERLVQSEQIAFQINLMRRFTEMADRAFGDLPVNRQRLLNEYGITPKQWDILRSATKESQLTFGSIKGLDYDRLYGSGDAAQIAAARQFQHMLISETGSAIFASPHLMAKAALELGRRGTVVGEVIRSVSQFGQWPLTAWHNMYGPLFGDAALIDKAAYFAMLLTSSTIAGFLGIQANQVINGKSLLPINDERTWLAAMLHSNIGANWGDMVTRALGVDDPFAPGFEPAAAFELSPALSMVHDIYTHTVGEPIHEARKGGGFDFEAAARTFGRTGLPELIKDFGAPFGVNLWQTRLAFERLVVNNIERIVDPVGYAQRQERIQQLLSQRGQSYFWQPTQ